MHFCASMFLLAGEKVSRVGLYDGLNQTLKGGQMAGY